MHVSMLSTSCAKVSGCREVIDKVVHVKIPTATTVAKFLRNTVAVLVVALTILGSILFVQVHNQTEQIQREAVIAKQVAAKAVANAIKAQATAAKGTSTSLCTSLDALAALQPPTGNSATNPSRAYEQQQHMILAGLAKDIKCPGA